MCTDIQNIYLVTLLFVVKSTCRLTITGLQISPTIVPRKPCSRKTMIKR